MVRKNNMIKMVLIFTCVMGVISFLLLLLSNIREKNNTYIYIDVDTMKLVQLEEPKEGDPSRKPAWSLVSHVLFCGFPRRNGKRVYDPRQS